MRVRLLGPVEVAVDGIWRPVSGGRPTALLALGRHVQLIPQLQDLVRGNPFDERLHGQLMLALYRAGRQVDALAVYQELRQAMVDELGLDPGPALRDQHAAMLRQDESLDLTIPSIT